MSNLMPRARYALMHFAIISRPGAEPPTATPARSILDS
jgi:hypothetical protein